MQTKAVKILVQTCLLLSIIIFQSGTSHGGVSNKQRHASETITKSQKSGTKKALVSVNSERGISTNSRKYSAELDCLAAVVYYEARGSVYQDQYSVADVTMNRVDHPEYPKSVCGVVSEPGQYTWYSRKKGIRIPSGKKSQEAWSDSKEIAAKAMTVRNVYVNKDVLFFHSKKVRPSWAKHKLIAARFGGHIYYSERSKKS